MSTAQKVLSQLTIVKEEPGGVYRCNSPFHLGSDSEAFVLKIEGAEHGAFYNFAAKKGEPEGGSLYDLAKIMGIEIDPSRTEAEQTKRPYRGLDEYAKVQGVEPDVFRGAGWEETTYLNRPALEFSTITGKRWRFIDGQTPRYTSPAGYQRCWYGLDKAIIRAKDNETALVLCNGEASTVVAHHYGLPAFCMTGGEKAIPDDLLSELSEKWQGRVVIALDCDDTGRRAADKIKSQISQSTVVDLGLTDGGDLANFCKLHTTESPAALWRVANRTAETQPAQANTAGLSTMIGELVKARKDKVQDMDALLDRIESEVSAIRTENGSAPVVSLNSVISSAVVEFTDRYDNPHKTEVIGFKTGLKTFDNLLCGFQEGMVHSFIAATSQGKSTLVASFVPALLEQAPGLVVSTETDPQKYLNKMVAAATGIPSDKINKGLVTKDEYEKVMGAYRNFRRFNMNFLQSRSPSISNIKRALDEGKGKYKWVIFDSLSNFAGSQDGIYARTSANSKATVEIAGDYAVAVVQTVQIGRAKKDEKIKIPSINDAKGAGDIEEDADKLIALYNHQAYVDAGEAQPDEKRFPSGTGFARLLKDRHDGKTGLASTIAFLGGCRFADYTPVSSPHYTDK